MVIRQSRRRWNLGNSADYLPIVVIFSISVVSPVEIDWNFSDEGQVLLSSHKLGLCEEQAGLIVGFFLLFSFCLALPRPPHTTPFYPFLFLGFPQFSLCNLFLFWILVENGNWLKFIFVFRWGLEFCPWKYEWHVK